MTKKDDLKFIALFKKLKALKNLTHEEANELIIEAYPKLELTDKRDVKVLIRPLVVHTIKNMMSDQETIEQIFELINDVYPKLYTNPSTLDNLFTKDVRQPVQKRFPNQNGEEHIFYTLARETVALPENIKGQLLKDASDKVEAKNRDYDVVDADEMLNIIKDNIISTDLFRRAIALLLCCGSREMELFATSNFEELEVPSGEKNWVIQDKVSKKKGSEVSVKKPVLYLTAKRFVEEVNSMRKSLKERYGNKIIEDGKLSSAISTMGNKVAHEIFKNRKGFTMHVCRKIYAHMSYDIYESKPTIHGKGIALAFWIQSVLAHEGQKAVASYSHIKLKHKLNLTKTEEFEEQLDEKPTQTVIVKNAKLENQIKKIRTVYDDFRSEKGFYPNKSKMEILAKDVAPRSVIRIFMKYVEENE